MERKAIIAKWYVKLNFYEGCLKICIETGSEVPGQEFHLRETISFITEFLNDLENLNP